MRAIKGVIGETVRARGLSAYQAAVKRLSRADSGRRRRVATPREPALAARENRQRCAHLVLVEQREIRREQHVQLGAFDAERRPLGRVGEEEKARQQRARREQFGHAARVGGPLRLGQRAQECTLEDPVRRERRTVGVKIGFLDDIGVMAQRGARVGDGSRRKVDRPHGAAVLGEPARFPCVAAARNQHAGCGVRRGEGFEVRLHARLIPRGEAALEALVPECGRRGVARGEVRGRAGFRRGRGLIRLIRFCRHVSLLVCRPAQPP
ncbi:hypothetical protein PT2222_280035 [Paraburkholderia tropica]